MPTTPYAKLRVSLDGGAYRQGGIEDATVGQMVQLSTENTSGITQYKWVISDAPPDFVCPSGWIETGDGTFYSLDAVPDDFEVTHWGKYLFDLYINDAARNASSVAKFRDVGNTALSVLADSGLRDVSYQESQQFARKGWPEEQRRNLRQLDNTLLTVDSQIRNFDTMAALRAAVETLTIGQTVGSLGHTTKGDGGAGQWEIVAIGSYVHNGGTVIAAASSPTKAAIRRFDGDLRARWFGFNPSASAANNVIALQAAIDAQSAGTVRIGVGVYNLNAEVNMRAGINLVGMGKTATRLVWSHTGRGLRMQSPVNSSSAVHISVQNIGLENSNGSNVDGAFVDQCGTYIDLVSMRTVGFKFGAILDQSELANILSCDFELPLKAGVWLTNGADYTATAAIQFTNRINITGNCQFNGGQYGIMDDGGYSHNFHGNNHNGATVAHIRAAGTVPACISGCEMEVGPVGVLTSALSESGSTGVGGAAVRLLDNIIVVDNYAVQVDSAGLIEAHGNFFYGQYAFAGMTNCSIANGSGNSIPGAAVKTIYQDNLATLHEKWALPSGGIIVDNVFHRDQAGRVAMPLAWYMGDDAAAITDYSGSPDVFTSFPNRGALKGLFSAGGSARPSIGALYTKLAPVFASSKVLTSTLAASSFAFLHDGTSAYTITVRFRTTSLAANQVICDTWATNLAAIGISFWISTAGVLNFWVGNGSGSAAVQLASASSAIAINTDYTATIVKNGTAVEMFINGTSVDSDTISSPSTSNPEFTLRIGSQGGTLPLVGYIPELIIHAEALQAVKRTVVNTYASRWTP